MNWIFYAFGAAFALAVADMMVKLAAGKLPDSLGLLLYGSVPFLAGLTWFLSEKARGIPHVIQSPQTIVFAVLVGVAFTFVTLALYSAFRNGAPISVTSPLIRLGGVVIAAVVGVLIWKEPISVRYMIGLAFSGFGIYLIITR